MKTKNLIRIYILFFLSMCQISWANNLSDINNDHVIGLPEAIYALGVTSGLVLQNTNESVDFKDYFFVEGSEYFYQKKSYDESTGANVLNYEYAHHLSKTINNQNTFIECWYGVTTYNEYYTIFDNTNFLSIGDYWNGWYDSQIKIGTSQMVPGDIFSSMYQINDFPYWCEFKFLGYEDVETQAGTFNDCLKISKLNSYKWGVLFSYFSKNVGLVKQVYTTDNDSYTLELIASLNGNTSYPSNLTIKRYYGQWNLTSTPSTTDAISFFYLPQNGNSAVIIFNNFPYLSQYQTISLITSDGSTFTSTNTQTDISATISGSTMSGTYNYVYWDETAQETKSLNITFSGTMGTN
ncbi:conserved hypothetical protein, secreted [Candidatus Magnetomorum sp. HK-1]|nr:conserved hypothetical protein, secreted [Candidatus Magnetomorum sp. HK-1]